MPRFPRSSPRQVATGQVSVDEQHEALDLWMNRNRVSRRFALKGAISGVGALALARLAVPTTALAASGVAAARVAPGSYHLGFSGRHLAFGPDPATTMWLSVQLSGRPPRRHAALIAEYGHNRAYGARAEVEVRNLVSYVPQAGGLIFAADQYYLHALARDLEPGRRYHYRFRLADGTVTPNATFRTAPRPGTLHPFTFTAIADEGINAFPRALGRPGTYPGARTPSEASSHGFDDEYYERADRRRSANPATTLVELIAADEPAFNLVGGDICYADPSGEGLLVDNLDTTGRYDDYDPYVWDGYLALIDQSAASSPWMFASGNHDMEMVALHPASSEPGPERDYRHHGYGGLLRRLDFGSNGPLSTGATATHSERRSVAPTVYSFTYANVAVISIDANELSYEIPANLGYSDGAQAKWIENELAAFRADTHIDFIVAFFHQCAYCTGTTHGSDAGVRDVLDPLFSAYQVDLVFQGHNHQYERTDPIRHKHPTRVASIGSTIRPALDGTTYVVVGSGGRPRYPFSAEESYAGRHPSTRPEPVRSFVDDLGGGRTPETVYWSRVRYDDYAYARIHVLPATLGRRTTMTVTAISDRQHTVDRFVLARTAGQAGSAIYDPPASAPEASSAILLPVAGLAVAGAATYLHHRRRQPEDPQVTPAP